MKFTKEQVIEKIKAMLSDATKGKTLLMTDKTITTLTEQLMGVVATEETELDAFIQTTLPIFESTNGQVRHDVAEQVRAAQATPQPQPQPQPTPTLTPQPTPQGFDMNALAATIQQGITAAVAPLQSEILALKGERSREQLIAAAKAKFMENKPDSARQPMIEKAYKTVLASIGEDATAETLAAAIKGEYDELVSIAGLSSGYVPVEGSGSSTNVAADMKAEVDRLKAAGLLPQ